MNPKMRSDVSMTRTEYGVVLLDERTSQYWQLTPTAGVVIAAFQAGEGTAGAVRRLTSTYPVTAQVATRDVVALLRKLQDIGVVTTA
jgi:hypothetical protein